MTGKERIISAFKLGEVDQTPWVIFVGCHGAKLMEKDAYFNLKKL